MRKFFEPAIAMLVAAASFLLCWKWHSQKQEIEPIIGMVASAGVMLTGLAYRFFPEKKGAVATDPPPNQQTATVENSKNTVANSTISAGGDVHIGDKTTVENGGANIHNQFNNGTFHNTTFH